MDHAKATSARRWSGLLLLFLPPCAALLVLAWRAAIAPAAAPATTTFASKLTARGARLAAIGDCDGCQFGAAPLAGGVALQTPFGIVYNANITNITPDATRIGEAAQGPSMAAIARAVADAIEARLRDLPLSRERVDAVVRA
jgi:hypothetical protein